MVNFFIGGFYYLLLRVIPCLMVSFRAFCSPVIEPFIEAVAVERNEVRISINESFKRAYLRDDFFAQYDEDIALEALPYEIITMPLIGNAIALIWISGKAYSIPSMDEELYYSLKRIKKIFRLSYPETPWEGKLIPEKLVRCKSPFLPEGGERRALLFSGGLDSTSSLFAHSNEKLMLITAWGQYDAPLHKEQAWQERKKRVIETAELYGHTNAFIKSNYAEFLNWPLVNSLSPEIRHWRVSAVDGMGWAGLVAPLFYAKGCSSLYIASSNSWYYPYIDCVNPFVDSSMRFMNARLLHDQFELTRLDKACFIAQRCKQSNLKRPYLKVCQRTKHWGDQNCCFCKKCLTTILSLCTAGDDHTLYGFPIPLKIAVERALDLLRRPVDYETLWNYIDIQSAMRAAEKNFSSLVKAALSPFLRMPLAKVTLAHTSSILKNRVDWKDFLELVPSVIMPSNLHAEKWAVDEKAFALLKKGPF